MYFVIHCHPFFMWRLINSKYRLVHQIVYVDTDFLFNFNSVCCSLYKTSEGLIFLMKIKMETGTDDIRAPEHTHRPRGILRSEFPELHSTSWPFGKSIYENPIHAADRINVPGYRCVCKLFFSYFLLSYKTYYIKLIKIS